MATRNVGGLRTYAEGIVPYFIKDAVVIPDEGYALALDDNGEVALPGGSDDLKTIGFSAFGGTGSDTTPVRIDVYQGAGMVVPAISGAAIEAGKTVTTISTAGKIQNGTTAGAILGRALTPAAGADERVWVLKS